MIRMSEMSEFMKKLEESRQVSVVNLEGKK